MSLPMLIRKDDVMAYPVKPCPFCGSDDLHIITVVIDDNEYDAIECLDCDGIFCSPGDTDRELYDAWNKRAEKAETVKVEYHDCNPYCSNCGTELHSAYATKYDHICDGMYCPHCGSRLEWK